MTNKLSADTEAALDLVNRTLTEAETCDHAVSVLNYDLETICPEKAMAEQSNVISYLENQSFKLRKNESFVRAAETLFRHRGELSEFDAVLAETLHRNYLKEKNLSPEKRKQFSDVRNQAFLDWLRAKKTSDFSIFAPSLEKIRDLSLEETALREERLPDTYDNLLDDYERGMTAGELDACFGRCLEVLLPMLEKIKGSRKKIRTDFLRRRVTDEEQRRMTDYLCSVIGLDMTRSAWALTEHPFTDGLWYDDARITTHFHPTAFASSMYSVIHEGGHALFEQLQPEENYTHHIRMNKTMGQHESVSRFYENIIGRSEAFIHLIYPETVRIFPEAMEGVSERELYEAVNAVTPSLIRTEADEFTYTLHIIIRYEIEKRIIGGTAAIGELPALWNSLYEKYLGIRPENDREGVLQDVHWASGFGYFPAYALGNFYNAMYYRRMKEDLSVENAVRSGNLRKVNSWMAEHVFFSADREDPKTWIRNITGRSFTAEDFLQYLTEKYGALYGL